MNAEPASARLRERVIGEIDAFLESRSERLGRLGPELAVMLEFLQRYTLSVLSGEVDQVFTRYEFSFAGEKASKQSQFQP